MGGDRSEKNGQRGRKTLTDDEKSLVEQCLKKTVSNLGFSVTQNAVMQAVKNVIPLTKLCIFG